MDGERGYNGFPNYPTYAVCLWLNNDEGPYRQALDIARQLAMREARPALQALVDDLLGHGWGLRGDLLTHAQRTKTPYYALLRQVDWGHVVGVFRD